MRRSRETAERAGIFAYCFGSSFFVLAGGSVALASDNWGRCALKRWKVFKPLRERALIKIEPVRWRFGDYSVNNLLISLHNFSLVPYRKGYNEEIVQAIVCCRR